MTTSNDAGDEEVALKTLIPEHTRREQENKQKRITENRITKRTKRDNKQENRITKNELMH